MELQLGKQILQWEVVGTTARMAKLLQKVVRITVKAAEL